MKIRLELQVSMNRAFDLSKLQADLQEVFDEWSDGRRLFSVETFFHGFEEALRTAVRVRIEDEIKARVGDVMVNAKGKPITNIRRAKTATRLSSIKADREFREFSVHVFENAKVEVIDDET